MSYQCKQNVAITKVSVNDPDEPDNYFLFLGEKRYQLLELLGALNEEEREHLYQALHQVEEQENTHAAQPRS